MSWYISPDEARALRGKEVPSASVNDRRRTSSSFGGPVATGGAHPSSHAPYKPALSQLHSEPSNEAAQKIEPSRSRLQTLVYLAIKKAGTNGLVDEEGIAFTDIPASTYRPRRCELVEANRVFDSGLTRRTRSGRRATVWVAR